MRQTPIAPGDIVADKYRVERLLATGGMGIVALARHIELDHDVAIKVVLGEDEPARAARFLREARAAAKVQSDHVARVYDHGKLSDGTPYIVMEHLRGADLRQVLKERGALPVTEAVDLMMEVLHGVGDAHALGIVHRDIKPANLFCVERGGRRTMKVLDFGISKTSLDASTEEQLTTEDAFLGSPHYIAPEQARSSKDVDARADIWSLGVVLYELLDGERPFKGSTLGETLTNILTTDPVPLSALRPDVPEALWTVVERCLQRDRDERHPSVSELARDLAPFGSDRARARALDVPVVALALVPRAPVSDRGAVDVGTRSSWAQASRRPSRRGAALLIGGAIAGAAMATLTVMAIVREKEPRPAMTPAPVMERAHAPTRTVPRGSESAAPAPAVSASASAIRRGKARAPAPRPEEDLLDTSN